MYGSSTLNGGFPLNVTEYPRIIFDLEFIHTTRNFRGFFRLEVSKATRTSRSDAGCGMSLKSPQPKAVAVPL